jgi:hypothetical protein
MQGGCLKRVFKPSDEELRGWLDRAFAGQPGWVVGERQPVDSFQQHMERVVLQWPDTGASDEVFVRVYRGYMSWWSLVTPDLPEREQAAWRIAWRAAVPVPTTLYTSRSPEGDVAIHRRVPGEPLCRVHAAPVREEERHHLPDISLAAFLPRLARWAEEAEDAGLRREVDEMAQRLSVLQERPPAFVHGDFHPGNVLTDGQRVTAILDWEEAALGDPRIDVAIMTGALREDSPDLADRFLAAYQEHVGFPLKPIDLWWELADLRNRIVGAWVKHRLDHQRPVPAPRPEAWFF